MPTFLLSPFQVTRLIPDAKGTSCNQRLERISGCEHSHILRVPFRTEHGIVRQWISRFDIWPYLENFAEVRLVTSACAIPMDVQRVKLASVSSQDAANEIAAELQAVPDLIIGNYSDGNLVASLLSYKMGVTEVNIIAHIIQSSLCQISLICCS